MNKAPVMQKEINALDFVVDEALKSYKEVTSLQESGRTDDINIDVEITKDRKLAIATKGIMTKIRCEQMQRRRLGGFNNTPLGQ